MGGAGVLCAAAKDCKDKIAAVIAMNPGGGSSLAPFDQMEGCVKYLTGETFSGEHGEGDIPFLADITAPTMIYGSQAEMNSELLPGLGCAGLWPAPPSQWKQIGANVKELYVDNLTENAGTANGGEFTPNLRLRLFLHPRPR